MSDIRNFQNKGQGKEFKRNVDFAKKECGGKFDPLTKTWAIDLEKSPKWAGEWWKTGSIDLVEVKPRTLATMTTNAIMRDMDRPDSDL